MKKKKLWMSFVLGIFCLNFMTAFAYCNETQIYNYKNITIDNSTQLVNITVLKECTETTDNSLLNIVLLCSAFGILLIFGGIYLLTKIRNG